MSSAEAFSSRGLIKSIQVNNPVQSVNIQTAIVWIHLLVVSIESSGLGLLSLYHTLRSSIMRAVGLRMAQNGLREIAAAKGEAVTRGRVLKLLSTAHFVLGGILMFAAWLLHRRS